jgi:hypothetical protein
MVIGPILDVYGDAGFIVLVGVAMGAVVVLLFRVSHPRAREVTPPTPLRLTAPCGKCDGTGRYVDADDRGWPCLEAIHGRFEDAA